MPRPHQPATQTITDIFNILIIAPSYAEEIQKRTGLHGNTVNKALEFLTRMGLVQRGRKGHKIMYNVVNDREGYGIPWALLMKPKGSDPKIWKQIRAINMVREELPQRVKERREEIKKLAEEPANKELIQELVKQDKDVTPRILHANFKIPFCSECLKNSNVLVRMVLSADFSEYCCPQCGVAVAKLDDGFEILKKRRKKAKF